MRTTTRSSALAVLLAGALVLTACGDGDDPTVASGDDSGAAASQAQFNDEDVEFVSGMVPHHEQAVEMADMMLAKSPSDPIRSLAERIKAAQEPEIQELDALLETFGEDSASGGHGGHGGGSEEARHGGMMTDEQMREMEAATGAEAERLFLTLMIEHHEGAIEAAQTVIAEGESRAVIDLATRIRDDQRAEIAEMEQLLTQL